MEGHKIKHSPLIDERSPGADVNRHDKHKGGGTTETTQYKVLNRRRMRDEEGRGNIEH